MANFHKYDTQAEYAAATDRASGESHVSMVGSTIVNDGVNIIVPFKECALDKGDIVIRDLSLSKRFAIKKGSYVAAALDTTRYKVIGYYYGAVSGKGRVVSKASVSTSIRWAINHIFHLTCDTSADGGFHYSVSINGTTRSGDISWSNGATLASIASSINGQTGMSGTATAKTGYIALSFASYTDSNFTISSANGATLDDMSKQCKINGVAQTETHRSFQAATVASLFPDLGWAGAATACYMKNGGNGSYRTGANLARYMAYWQTNGVSTYAAETGTDIINKATFESFATATGDSKALYDKYNGSWAAYMANRMMKLPDLNAGGVDYMYFDNGLEMTAKLASITTKDENGDWVPAYPAAAAAYGYAVADVPEAAAGNWNLPSAHEMGMMFEDEAYAAINNSATATGGTALSNSGYYWAVAECNANNAWSCNGNYGTLTYNSEYNTSQSRPTLALDFD